MIEFNYETSFELEGEEQFKNWLESVIASEGKRCGEISYIFCDDQYLLGINQQYLKHDDYTDIISFDYSLGDEISGDIFISVDRVRENAETFQTTFDQEIKRVMVHGILHYCGYKDKTELESQVMRSKEEEKIKAFAG
jgi:probable rRNA maturation factor